MISIRWQVCCLALSATVGVKLVSCSQSQTTNLPRPNSSSPELSPSSVNPAPTFKVSVPLPPRLPATQPWKIAYVLKTQSDCYWQSVKQAAIAFGEDLAVDIRIIGSHRPQNAQFVEEQIILLAEQLKQGELDGLVLAPADSIRLVPIVEQAPLQGIPVIVMDTPLESNSILTFVGFDNLATGEAIGQWVVQKLGGAGNILILEGAGHHDNALERHKGFLAGLKTGDMKVLSTRSANWDLVEAQEIVRKWLRQYPHIDAILAANDEMALGAIAAITESGRQDILVTGFDGSQKALAALQSSQLATTIDQIPEHQVRLAIELMIAHLESQQPLPPKILLKNMKLITPNNLVD